MKNVNLLDNKLFSLGCSRMCIIIFFWENKKSAFAVITTDSSFRADLGRPFFDNWNDPKSLRNGGSSIRGGWNWEQRATSWSSRRLRCHVWVFAARLITCIDQQRKVRENGQTYPTHTTLFPSRPILSTLSHSLHSRYSVLATHALKPFSLSNLS